MSVRGEGAIFNVFKHGTAYPIIKAFLNRYFRYPHITLRNRTQNLVHVEF